MFLHHMKKGKEKKLNLKVINIINHNMGWIKIIQYGNKREISTTDLVETNSLTRYPCPSEITYDQGLKLLVMISEIPNLRII